MSVTRVTQVYYDAVQLIISSFKAVLFGADFTEITFLFFNIVNKRYRCLRKIVNF